MVLERHTGVTSCEDRRRRTVVVISVSLAVIGCRCLLLMLIESLVKSLGVELSCK